MADVEVFRNLTKKCYSIRANRRVVNHVDSVMIKYARFVVQPSGRERVRRERKKYVHAFVRGEYSGFPLSALWMDGIKRELAGWQKVTYNPFKNDTFVLADSGEEVRTAELVWLSPDGVFASGVNKWDF